MAENTSYESSLISTLPLELLDAIFLLVTTPTRNAESGPFWCWLTVTHVCRTWRLRALSVPLLWTQLDFAFGNEEWAKECLLRARTAPLALVQPRNLKRMATFGNLIENPLRIRSLHVSNASECVGALHGLLSRPCTLLETLRLSSSDSPWAIYTMYLQRNLFAGAAPRLQDLELHGFLFQWPTFSAFTSLRRLILCAPSPRVSASHILIRPRDKADMAPSEWTNVISTLRELPELRELCIEYCWPKNPVDTSCESGQPLGLHHMKKLVIAGEAAQCGWFMRQVRVPSHAQVDVTCLSSASSARRDLEVVAPFLSSRFAHTEVKFSSDDSTGIRLEGTVTSVFLQWDHPQAPGRAEACTVDGSGLKELGLGLCVLQ